MPSDDDWTWKFAPRAADQFDSFEPDVQDCLVSKLDEVVESEWRDPDEFLEPLTGGPFSKLRVRQYQLACVLDRSDRDRRIPVDVPFDTSQPSRFPG